MFFLSVVLPVIFFFFLETNHAQIMEEKPGLGLQSGGAIEALIRVGTIKQPVCSLGNTLSPANYLPVAEKLSDSSDFFQHKGKKKKKKMPHQKENKQQTTDPPPTRRSLSHPLFSAIKTASPCFCREKSCAASAHGMLLLTARCKTAATGLLC